MKPVFDFNKFLRRKNFKQKDAAAAVGASMGLIGTWAAKGAVPSYEKIAKLIDLGITAQELFGEELGSKLIQNSIAVPPAELANDPDFQEGLQQSIDAKVSAAVKAELAALKSKGML